MCSATSTERDRDVWLAVPIADALKDREERGQTAWDNVGVKPGVVGA